MGSSREEKEEKIEGVTVTRSGRKSIEPVRPDMIKEKKRKREPREPGGFFGRCAQNAELVPMFEGSVTSSPARRIQEEMKKSRAYFTPRRTKKKDASTLVTTTPRHRQFDHILDMELKKGNTHLRIALFLDEESTHSDSSDEESPKSLADDAIIKRPKSASLAVPEVLIDRQVLADAKQSQRVYSQGTNPSGQASQLGFFGKFDRSHFTAHSQGSFPAISLEGDSLVTALATEEHNSTRLVAVESPATPIINRTEGLKYSNSDIELEKDDLGAMPIVKRESPRWKNKKDDSVTFGLKASRKRPAEQIYKFSQAVMMELESAEGDPADKENKQPTRHQRR